MRKITIWLGFFFLSSAVQAQLLHLEEQHLDCLIEPNQNIELGSPVPGVIEKLLVDRADTVTAGQPLVQLESSVEEASTQQAQERARMDGNVKARRADLHLARQNMQRMEKLFKRKMVSSQQRDEARAEHEVARRNYQVAQENQRLAQLELRTYQAKLAQRIIRSPIDGVVVSRLSMPGEFVDERPLLSLAQLDPLRVEVLMPAEMFGAIKPGMRAEVHPEIKVPNTLTASVTTVDRLIDSASGTFRVRLALPNPEHRIPGGLKCSARFLDEPMLAQESIEAEQTLVEQKPTTLPAAETNKPAATEPAATEDDFGMNFMAAQAAPLAPAAPVIRHERTTTPPTIEEPLATPRWCAKVGGFDSKNTADQVRERFESAGIEAVLTPHTKNTVRDYAVHTNVPPKQRKALLQQLKAAGFTDVASYVSSKSGETIISAGLYSRLPSAEQRQSQLAQKGFKMQIVPRLRERTHYTLSISAESQQQLAQQLNELALKDQKQVSKAPCTDAIDPQHAAAFPVQ